MIPQASKPARTSQDATITEVQEDFAYTTMIFNQEVNTRTTGDNILKVSCLGPISPEAETLARSVENGYELQSIMVGNGWLHGVVNWARLEIREAS